MIPKDVHAKIFRNIYPSGPKETLGFYIQDTLGYVYNGELRKRPITLLVGFYSDMPNPAKPFESFYVLSGKGAEEEFERLKKESEEVGGIVEDIDLPLTTVEYFMSIVRVTRPDEDTRKFFSGFNQLMNNVMKKKL